MNLSKTLSQMAKQSSGVSSEGSDNSPANEPDKDINLTELAAFYAKIKAKHWKTDNYNTHVIFDRAFKEVGKALDPFVECTQGYYNSLSSRDGDITISFNQISDPIACADSLMEEFLSIAKPLIDGIDKPEYKSALESLRDNVTGAFLELKSLLIRNK